MRVRNVGSLLTQARHGHVGLKALQHAYLVMCRGSKKYDAANLSYVGVPG